VANETLFSSLANVLWIENGYSNNDEV